MAFFYLELTYCKDHAGVCENNGTCVSLTEEDGNYRCLCTEDYTGRNCDVLKVQPTTEEAAVNNEATPPSRRRSKIMNLDNIH